VTREYAEKRAVRAALAAAAILLLAATACPAEEDEARPKIFLEKRVYSSATETGQRVFYETRTVAEGDTLWKILTGRGAVTPDRYAEQLREFRRINPSVADPDHLVPGQKLQVPLPPAATGEANVREGKAVAHVVAKGQSLTRILRARGVVRKEMKKYLGAVKALNPSVRNPDRILAGKTIYLPTEGYFRPAEARPAETAASEAASAAPKLVEAAAETAPAAQAAAPVAEAARDAAAAASPKELPAPTPAPVAETARDAAAAAAPKELPAPTPAPSGETSGEPQAAALTREANEGPTDSGLATGKPDAQLAPPPAVPAAEPPRSSVTASPEKSPPGQVEPERPPYRGLLADVVAALGEKWIDRGTLYLPTASGGEVVIDLSDFPVVRFGTGSHALIDFRGTLPPEARALVSETWKDYRIVPMDGAPGPGERIDRLLAASGYASVKEGMSRPLVIGESVAVTLPSRWQLFRTRQALEAGDVTLLKVVPERLSPELDSVLTYASRVGIRVLPVAWDLSAREGFLAGLAERKRLEAPEPRRLPAGGLPAFDSAAALLGIAPESDPMLKVAGKDDAFRLTIRPERTFEFSGVRYVVDTGRMSPAIRSLVKGAGYRLFELGKGESGKVVFLRLLKLAGHPYEERRRYRVAGGPEAGFELTVTGTFVTSKAMLESRAARAIVVVKGRQHAATRAMLREMGIEVIEWTD
jgi:hypothetical protein